MPANPTGTQPLTVRSGARPMTDPGEVSGNFKVNTMLLRGLAKKPRKETENAPPKGPDVINGLTSGQRWDQGLTVEAQRLIPSKAANPLDAQRKYRGGIIILILFAMLIGVMLNLWLSMRVANRTVIVAPEAQLLGGSGLPTVTDEQVNQFVMGLVQRMETWTYSSAKEVPNFVLPFCHPSIHENIRSEYEELSARAQNTFQSRTCSILGTLADQGRQDKGLFLLAVVFERVDMAGVVGQNKTISSVDGAIATFQIIQGPASSVNPLGLTVMKRTVETRKHWLSAGRPDFWASFKMTEGQKQAAAKAQKR